VLNNEPPEVGCYQKSQFQKRSEIFTEGREGNEEETETASASRPFPRVGEKVAEQSGRMEAK